jgi:hypothetical protein
MLRRGLYSIPRLAGVNVLFCLAALSTAAFATTAEVLECITRVTTYAPREPVRIQGLDDETYFGLITSQINSFWREKYEAGISPGELGVNGDTFERYGLHDRILIPEPEYVSLEVRLYNGKYSDANGEFDDDFPAYNTGIVYLSHVSLVTKLAGMIRNDSSWAYVMAHEAGHHIQHHLRVLTLPQELRYRAKDNFQTRLELQADCLAGIWIGANPGLFGEWDIQSLKEMTKHMGSDDHGTSEQRWRWLQRGITKQSIKDCDTFAPHWYGL